MKQISRALRGILPGLPSLQRGAVAHVLVGPGFEPLAPSRAMHKRGLLKRCRMSAVVSTPRAALPDLLYLG
ncbi:hypothetical protein [Zoogloea sp.]|uniref:hypothetical protein n=1 Tax=Zoogloea sp. TaxID=49181 RepID=UPI0035B36869